MIRAEIDLDHKVGCHLTNLERPSSLTILERCKSSSRIKLPTKTFHHPLRGVGVRQQRRWGWETRSWAWVIMSSRRVLHIYF